jgi:hypothetical protein
MLLAFTLPKNADTASQNSTNPMNRQSSVCSQ